MGRSARVTAGRTIDAGPAQPADGRKESLSANTSTSSGATQYSGMAMKDCVTVVITLSVAFPCRRPAAIPSGRDTTTARPNERTTRLSVTARAGRTWSATGVRLTCESPMSPVTIRPSQRKYWSASGS